jgi:hypothetical protein
MRGKTGWSVSNASDYTSEAIYRSLAPIGDKTFISYIVGILALTTAISTTLLASGLVDLNILAPFLILPLSPLPAIVAISLPIRFRMLYKTFLRRNNGCHVIKVTEPGSNFSFLWALGYDGSDEEKSDIAKEFNREIGDGVVALSGSMHPKDKKSYRDFIITTKLVWNGEGELDMNEAVRAMREHTRFLCSSNDDWDDYIVDLDYMPDKIDLINDDPYADLVNNNVVLGNLANKIHDLSSSLETSAWKWCDDWVDSAMAKMESIVIEATVIHKTMSKTITEKEVARLHELESESSELRHSMQLVADSVNTTVRESIKDIKSSAADLTKALRQLKTQEDVLAI